MAGTVAVTMTTSHVAPPFSSSSPSPPLPPPPPPPAEFDPHTIILEGDEDPRNWSPLRKWGTTAIISLMGFISPLGSSVIVPGGPFLDRHFQLRSRELSLLPVSFFVLGLGIGPFLLAPASELKGRQPIFLVSSILFVLFNIGTALVDNFGALCFLRFLAGATGSTGPSLGAGSIGDLFAPRERGRAQSLYGLGPLLGPVCGAIAGGWISQRAHSWRWLLWFLTILSAIIAVIVAIFLRETYAPVLLRRKVKRRMLEHSIASASSQSQVQQPAHSTSSPSVVRRVASLLLPSRELRDKTRLALTRPFRLLFTNPICAIFSLYMGFIYGIIFIFLTQHPLLFQRRETPEDPPPQRLPTYGWTTGLASLTYLGLGLGFLVAASINVILQDEIYSRLALNRGRIGWVLFCKKREIAADALHRSDRLSMAEHAGVPPSEVVTAEHQHQAPFPIKNKPASMTVAALQEGEKMDTIERMTNEATDAKRKIADSSSPTTIPLSLSPGATTAESKQPPAYLHAHNHITSTAIAASNAAVNSVKGRPEYRLPLCLVGMVILPCGLLVFGWTADARAHFMLPLVGSFLVGVGSILPFQAILVYLVDAFIPFSASATACAVFVRCVLAAVFPLFSQRLIVEWGFGWASTLLALVSCLAIPVPILLFKRGEKLRKRFHFEG